LVVGTSSQPSKVGRVLDDGTTQLYQYAYNQFDRVTSSIDPLGRESDFIYAANLIDLLEVHQKTGPNPGDYEVLAKATYNTAHQPLTATDAAGQVTTFTYNSRGQPLTVTNARNETTTFAYDPNGYLLSVTGAIAGATTTFAYDGYGRLRTVTDSEGYAVTTDYDAFDRPTLVTYPDSTTRQITYDKLDAVAVTDRRGRISRTAYNAIRQIVTSTDPLGRTTQFAWCKCGALRLLTDPAGNTTAWTHDVRARVTSKQFPDGSALKYNYEANASRLKSVIDAKAQVTNYQYFVDDSLKQVSYANAAVSTPTVSYAYDVNYPRLVTMTDGVGTTTYAYNPIPTTPTLGAGRLASVTGPLANSAIAYGYDELGRVLTRSINGPANASSAAYDALGRVSQISNPLGIFNYAYVNATGRLDHVIYPNSQRTNYGYYNNAGDQRLQQIQNLKSDSSNLSTFAYTYDPEGMIEAWSKQIDYLAAQTSGFKYDLADQLTEATIPTASSSTDFIYRYDKAGNRTSEQIDNAVTAATVNNVNQLKTLSATGPIRFEGTVNKPATVTIAGQAAATAADNSFQADVPLPPGPNAVAVVATDGNGNTATKNYQVAVASGTTRTLTYDLNGNLTDNGAGQIYAWDAANRLVRITQMSGVTEFVYDGAGRRVQEKLNGSIIKQWVWCPGDAQPCEERDAGNNVTKRFYGGLGEQIGGVNYFFTVDHLGSVREMTDLTGAVRARYDYDPYGRITKLSGDLDGDFGFTGLYRHQASGLSFTLYRAYDANLGRWLSRDPIGEAGGLNLYGYVGNNPVNFADRDGRFAIGAVVGAVVGGISGWAGAAASHGTTGDKIVAALAGAGLGALAGALDPSEGILSSAIVGGSTGAVADLIGQDFAEIRKMRQNQCYNGKVNYAELGGAFVGGAIGGALGTLTERQVTGATSELGAKLVGQVPGFVPSTFGGLVGEKAVHPGGE
jgi:RHS repeat-associated protein